MPDHRPGPDWARIHGTEILDPDGWRAAGIPFDWPITLDDYNRLAATSTQRPARTPTEPAAELEQASGAPTKLASPHRETGRAIRDAGGIPPGPWRVGSQCGRNLWIGPPRPDGVDVGRMDTDALAAHVVQAVNERDRLRAALRDIVNTLGPDRVCDDTHTDGCPGLRTEAAEALRIAREALTTDVQGG